MIVPSRVCASLVWRGVLVSLMLAIVVILPSRAVASSQQKAIFQDYASLFSNPSGTLQQLRALGAQEVRLSMLWYQVAPRPNSRSRPKHFREGDPAFYPAANWAIWDQIIQAAQRNGIQVDLDLAGLAPLWATAPGAPHDGHLHHNWEPSAKDYGLFVRAVAQRYSGNYDPVAKRQAPGNPRDLPRISIWSFWNEPNLGFMLAPQGVPGNLKIENSARMYRQLLGAAWSALHRTGHGSDTTLIGETAPRGVNYWGVFSSMKPLVFLRALYCVDTRNRKLRGTAAAARGCPTTAAGSRRFRGANPALFQATAFADHMWMRWYPPDKDPEHDRNYTDLPAIGALQRTLDRAQAAYGSRKRFAIYNTEFGYITNPPNHSNAFISPATAAYYLNWAEYISWRNGRIASFAQYLLRDPGSSSKPYTGWASGLLTIGGQQKLTYDAWRLPLYMPVRSAKPYRSLEVWGCVRPANFAIPDTGLPQTAQLQFLPNSGGQWTTLQTVTISNPNSCYFDVHVPFQSSGSVRLSYTYPATDPLFPQAQGQTVYSRPIAVTVSGS